MATGSTSSKAADRRLLVYVSRWWQELVHLDGKTWRSVREVVTCPGRAAHNTLEAEASESRPEAVHPIRIYLTINLVFFLLAPVLRSERVEVWQIDHSSVISMAPSAARAMARQIERSGAGSAVYEMIFDERMAASQGVIVALWIPCLALAAFLVARRRRPFLVEHLLLATNLVSFLLISLLVVGAGLRVTLFLEELVSPVGSWPARVLLVIWLGWVPWTVHRSVRVFYDLGSFRGLALTGWLGLAFMASVVLYQHVLFWITLFGLRDVVLPAAGS